MGLGPVKSVAATVNLNGAADTGHVVQGLVNGQAVGPAYIPSAGSLGYGTVTSVAQTVPAEFSVAGSPVTTSGTLAITKATQTANKVWASATSGGAAQPAFRALVLADLPSGVVTSVALTAPAEFSVAGSPITGAGTLAVTKATQVANTVWSGPTTGANAQPAFRALVAADIPTIAQSQVTNLVTDLAAKATDTLVVHLAGTESITGNKTFGTGTTTKFPNGSLGTPALQSANLGQVYFGNSGNGLNFAVNGVLRAEFNNTYDLALYGSSGTVGGTQMLRYLRFSDSGTSPQFTIGYSNAATNAFDFAVLSTGNPTLSSTSPCIPLMAAQGVDATTGTATPTLIQSGTLFTTRAGARTIIMPNAAYVGYRATFRAAGGNVLTVRAGTGQTIYIGSSNSTAAGTATSAADGSTLTLVFTQANTWEATSSTGTWTLA